MSRDDRSLPVDEEVADQRGEREHQHDEDRCPVEWFCVLFLRFFVREGRLRLGAGHTQDEGALDLNWRSLADPDTTLIVYMGRTNVRQIADKLIEYGLPAATPAAAIIDGTRPEQTSLFTTLAELAQSIEKLDRAAPTLLVIGRVVALAETLAWFRPAANAAKDAGTRSTG